MNARDYESSVGMNDRDYESGSGMSEASPAVKKGTKKPKYVIRGVVGTSQ